MLLRAAWRRRYRLGLAVLVAAVAFAGLGGLRAGSRGAVASTRVALDTPKSQLIAVAPGGGTTLPWRASLLANLMTTATGTAELAHRLGVPADRVAATDSDLTTPLVQTNDAQAVATASSVAAPFVLTVSDSTDVVPLISLQAAAPTRADAQRLAAAAVAVLKHEASPPGTFQSAVKTDGGLLRRQPFVVDQVAPITSKATSAGSLPRKALAASLFAFVAIAGLGGVAGRLLPRRLSLRRRLAAGT